jgi:predicted kinase
MSPLTPYRSHAYIVVGAPGSGKSTYAARLAERENAVIISGDQIRAELYGDANIQGEWMVIQDRIENLIEENVGKVLIMDGTHYRAKYRKDVIALLQSYGYHDIRAIVVNPSLEICLKQNAARARNVPELVIEKMHSALQASLRGVDTEGFSVVEYVGC